MTTALPPAARSADRVLLGAGAVAVVATVLLALIGALTTGGNGFAGALVGGAIAVGAFAFGTFSVNLVARLMPGLSLLFALLTYALQILLVGALLLALDRSGALGDQLSAGWTAAGVIAVTLAWTFAQVYFATRARIPAYELDRNGAQAPSAPVREAA